MSKNRILYLKNLLFQNSHFNRSLSLFQSSTIFATLFYSPFHHHHHQSSAIGLNSFCILCSFCPFPPHLRRQINNETWIIIVFALSHSPLMGLWVVVVVVVGARLIDWHTHTKWGNDMGERKRILGKTHGKKLIEKGITQQTNIIMIVAWKSVFLIEMRCF